MEAVRSRIVSKRAILLVSAAFVASSVSALELSAEARPTSSIPGDFDPVWTPAGRIAFYRNGKGLYTVKPDGSGLRRLRIAGRDPAWTRDGGKLAFSRGVETVCPQIVTSNGPLVNSEIFTARADGAGATRLTRNPAPDTSPTWSPDGRRIAFSAVRDTGECMVGISALLVMNEDGSGQSRLATGYAPDWSPTGETIAYAADVFSIDGGGRRIYTIRLDGSARRQLTFARSSPDAIGPIYDDNPVFSPDGERILFTRSGRSVRPAVYVIRADGSELRRLADGNRATWSGDGKQIAFERLRGRMDIYLMNADGTGQRKLLRSPAPTRARAETSSPKRRAGFSRFDLATGELDGKRVLDRTAAGVTTVLGKPNYIAEAGPRRTFGYRAHPPFSVEVRFKRVAGTFRARSLVLEDVTLAEVRIGRLLRLPPPEIARRILAAYPTVFRASRSYRCRPTSSLCTGELSGAGDAPRITFGRLPSGSRFLNLWRP